MLLIFPVIISLILHDISTSPSPIASALLPQGGSEATLISIGSMTYLIYTNIDLSLNFTWISPYLANGFQSDKTVGTQIITLFGNEYKASICEEEMRMENNLNKSKIIMKNFRYYYLKNEIKSERDSIGLGRLFTNTQYSFTHQMFLNHYIDKLSFSFILNEYDNNDKDHNYLFFGTPPLTFLDPQTTKSLKCNVKQELISWSCDLNKVEFPNTKIKPYVIANQIGYFQTYKYKILAPRKFIDYLYKHMFYDYFLNNTCHFNDDDNCNRKIICNKEYENNFNGIQFCFGEESTCLLLPQDKLFSFYFRDHVAFVIEENFIDKETETKWLFGKYFMPLFNTTFSYEDNTITFYSNDNIVLSTASFSNNNIIRYCFIGIMMLMSFASVLMFINNKYLK